MVCIFSLKKRNLRSILISSLILVFLFSCKSPEEDSRVKKDLQPSNHSQMNQVLDTIEYVVSDEDSSKTLQPEIFIDVSPLHLNNKDTSQMNYHAQAVSLLKLDSLRYTYSRISETSFAIDPAANLMRFENSWTDGVYWFRIGGSNDGGLLPYVDIFGGNRHEGGADSRGVLLNDSTIFISESMHFLNVPSLLISTYFSGVNCFLNISLDGELIDIMVSSNINFANDMYIIINDKLAGRYLHIAYNEKIEFFGNDNLIRWHNDSIYKYEFEDDEYEQLSNIVTFDGSSYSFQRKHDTLELTQVFPVIGEFDSWDYSKNVNQYLLIQPSKVMTYEKFKQNLRKEYYKISL